MEITFLGKESVPDQSPTLYATDRDTYVVQGWIVTDPTAPFPTMKRASRSPSRR